MFDFDAGKLIIVGIVALIVIGPKELPRVMLQVGQAAAKMRRMTAEFRSQLMDVIREAEIDETKSDVERLAERAKAATGMDPLEHIHDWWRYPELAIKFAHSWAVKSASA